MKKTVLTPEIILVLVRHTAKKTASLLITTSVMSSASTFLGTLPSSIRFLNGGTVSRLDFRAYNAYTERRKRLFGELSSSAVNTNDTISLGKVADQIRRHRQRDQTIAHVSILAGNRNINACQDTLNLVIRLILMVELGSLEKPSGFMHPAGSRPLPLWDKNSLDSLTEKVFPISLQQSCSGITMTPEFSAWSLENVAEIKIEFTDNLADHLRLTNNNNQLYIFHHVAFLEAQRHRSVSHVHLCII
jgi:hypothetical protein